MSDIAIRVEGLSKQYRIGKVERYRTLRDSLTEAVTAPFRHRTQSPSETIWALKDVSFEIPRGAVVGVIGSNGAGKSTLLKVLSRITEPTEGHVEIRGRVGSLLEVGTGFHPELTGRDNIFLNGAILGMRKAEIARKFDEIVAFAEVERFIDTPVKHYSSGMYMRLAFAVAAHLEPEILIVDEVLAVGDAQFQKKCLMKMQEVGKQGRTVLFVSHNLTAVQSLCDTAIWLNEGRLAANGDTARVVSKYLQSGVRLALECSWNNPFTAPGDNYVRLNRVIVKPRTAKPTDLINVQTAIDLEFVYWNLVPNTLINLSVVLYNSDGTCIFNSISVPRADVAGTVRQVCEIPKELLNNGTYRVRLLVVKDTSDILIDEADLVIFDVHDVGRTIPWYGGWIGAVRPKLAWKAEVIQPSAEMESLEAIH